ncbi:three-Cys-motif partner protein TcmP [Sphingomonas sp. PvP056]|uniref:three-Cys-motif partner protein TcmP n=1 Tax=Sphingomonas sp. PvP056 TaxID=3156392 RepID=UPI0033985312
MPDIANYGGREQAFIKHHFLANYVDQLVFKVGSRRDIVYVDGFSGPWQDQADRFEDTSFGIALRSLRRAKQTWKDMGRGDRTMRALLVERDPDAYARLQKIVPLYPDIDIRTFNGDFVKFVPDLLRAIPADAFSFVLMDPKGWKIDMKAVAPLLHRPNSEVVFNFMFTMINWSASMPNAAIQAGLEALMPNTDWKPRLDGISVAFGQSVADARKAVLVAAISEAIGGLGGYPYVMETPVLFPLKNRTYYSLIYATRSTKGVEVFRDCQNSSLKAQDKVRSDLQSAKRDERAGMVDMFGAAPTGDEFAARWLAEQEREARAALIDGIPEAPRTVTYGELWPRILAKYGVRKTRLGRIAAELKSSGEIDFLDWGHRKQVPDDTYRMSRGIKVDL